MPVRSRTSRRRSASGTDSNQDQETVPLGQGPQLTLSKEGALDAGADGLPDAGDVITYTLTVTNDGNVTVTGVSISDPLLPSLECDQPVDLAPGETLTCTGTNAVGQGEINEGSVANTGTVTGSDPNGNNVEDRADEDVPLAQAPHLTLEKEGVLDAGADGLPDAGDVITYTLTATNDGNVTLKGVSISDPSLASLECDQPVDLAPGEKLTCTGTNTVGQGEINDGSVANTATVTGSDPDDNDIEDRADEDVPLAQAPHLSLEKEGVLDAGADGLPNAGDVITYTLTATNDGNVTLKGVSISDPSLPTLECDQPVDLAPGEKLTCTGTHTVGQGEFDDGSVANTATVGGSDPNGGEVEDRADEQVPLDQVPHLTLVKEGGSTREPMGVRTRAT